MASDEALFEAFETLRQSRLDFEEVLEGLATRLDGRPTKEQAEIRSLLANFRLFRELKPEFDRFLAGVGVDAEEPIPKREPVFGRLIRGDFGPLIEAIDEESDEGFRLALQNAFPVIGLIGGILAALGGLWWAEENIKDKEGKKQVPPVLHSIATSIALSTKVLQALTKFLDEGIQIPGTGDIDPIKIAKDTLFGPLGTFI